MSFKVIETQDEFDSLVKERIERAKESTKKQFEGYMSPSDVENLKKDYELRLESTKDYMSPEQVQTIKSEYEAKINKSQLDLDRFKIAQKFGLPEGLANRLQGSNADELTKDAESLANMMPKPAQNETWPSASAEAPIDGKSDSAAMALLNQFSE